jgi:signal transduction histidine kinase
VYTDATQTKILASGNIDSTIIKENKSDAALIQWIQGENEPLKIDLGNGVYNYIFYKDSDLLKQLKFFPIIQLSVISLFLFVAYFLFSTARRSEQNRVWVGMSKETAHQLGTPLSSLIGWLEILKAQGTDEMVTTEMANDIQRLQTVAERFSKVGSVPELKRENLFQILNAVIRYMEIRTSDKIKFTLRYNIPFDTELMLSKQLFEWVIENLFRNAVDAIQHSGSISVEVSDSGSKVFVDVIDSGKGIEKKDWKTIFRPGFTTKKRGWGLGLSLANRIIDDYHKGRIYVKSSEPGETVFRIVLPKA